MLFTPSCPRLFRWKIAALLGLGAACGFLPLNTVLADDPALYLKFYRQQDSYDGNFTRTQTGTTTPLSDSASGLVGNGSVSVSLGGYDVNDFSQNALTPAGTYRHGNMESDATSSQTYLVTITNRPASDSTGAALTVDYRLSGSFDAAANSNSSAYARFTNRVDGSTAEYGYNINQYIDPNVTHKISGNVTFGYRLNSTNTDGSLNYIASTELSTDTHAFDADTNARLNISIRQGAIHLVDSQGRQIGFTMSSPGGNAAAKPVASGASYAGFMLTNSASAQAGTRGTTVSVLDGTASTSRVANISFTAAPASNQGVRVFSDAADFSGTANAGSSLDDLFVLQFKLDETAVLAAGLTDTNISLKWLDPSDGQYKEAYLGDSDGGAAHRFLVGQYLGGTEFQLGNYGVDPLNHTVWAVLDHNSVFVAGTAVPEPSSWSLLGVAGILSGLVIVRRRQGRTGASHPLGKTDRF